MNEHYNLPIMDNEQFLSAARLIFKEADSNIVEDKSEVGVLS